MTGRFEMVHTPIDNLVRIDRKRMGDDRGWFERMFCSEELAVAGWSGGIAQINRTLTARRGTVRGMHFQRALHAEKKFVSCIAGEVFDVAVDLREGSPSFLSWHAEILSAENARSLLIPEGFAHGFQALSDDVEMLYFHSAPYAPQAEGGLRPDDSRLGIVWPLAITEMSERDRNHPLLSEKVFP